MRTTTSARPVRSSARGRVVLAAAVAAAVAVLPACGGGDDDDKGSGASATPSASAAAVAGASTKDESGVRAEYAAFEKAGAAKDSKAIASMVSASTLTYFDKMRDLALDADKATLTKQPVIDQLTALGMRAKVDPKILRDGSPQDVVAASANAGGAAAAPASATGAAEKAKITVTGDTAQASDPATPTTELDFAYESGGWKVDVTGAFKQLGTAVQGMAKANPVAFVEQAMASQVGGAAKVAALWTPIGR